MTTTTTKPAAERRRTFLALQHRDFRLLWFGQIISQTGSQMTVVGVSWQLYELTGSKLSLGLIGLVRLLPLLIFSLGSGMLADAADRRKVMIGSQSVMCLLALVLAVTTSLGLATAMLIYAVLALHSAASTFDMPARQALVPSLVPREHLTNALSLNIVAWQIATVVGPMLAGVLIAWRHSVDAVYALDALSYGAVLLSLLLMRTRHIIDAGRPPASIGAALEGLRFVRRTPIIFWTMTLDFAATLFAGAMTLMPVFAKDILHVGPQGLGMLYAAPSVGAVLAGLALSWLAHVRRQGAAILWSVALYGICTAIFGISTSFLLSCLMLAGLGAADTVSMVIRNTLRQTMTPDQLRGRMVAVNQVFFAGGPQLGELEAGIVAQWAGAPFSVLTGGLACVLAVLVVALGVPQLRRYQDHTR